VPGRDCLISHRAGSNGDLFVEPEEQAAQDVSRDAVRRERERPRRRQGDRVERLAEGVAHPAYPVALLALARGWRQFCDVY